MAQRDCGHEATESVHLVCIHLLEALQENKRTAYTKIFTGKGRMYSLACRQCADIEPMDAIPWSTVCEACFRSIQKNKYYWNGFRGTPEIGIEPANLAFTHRLITDVAKNLGNIRLIQPVPDAPGSRWLALTTRGTLVELDLDAKTHRGIADIAVADFDDSVPLSLVCSSDGRFLCLAQTLGDHGVVIDTVSGESTMRLLRDGYQTDVSPFPAAFMMHEDRPLFIHSPEWNRLDISDPATGELLTDRSPTSYEKGEDRPPHYLDYFHGHLYVSPDNEFIADDGWVWHPIGEVRIWNARRWLTANVWESEDGASVQDVAGRAYFWGGPMCWVDHRTLAVWGYGTDQEALLPGVSLFDAISGKEKSWFPGPEVAAKEPMIGLEHLADFGGRLFFDKYLFAVSERFGTSVWDVEHGTRLHLDESFVPATYHPSTKEFLTIHNDGTLQLSRLIKSEEK